MSDEARPDLVPPVPRQPGVLPSHAVAAQELRAWRDKVAGWFKQLFEQKKLDEKYDETESAKAALQWYRDFKLEPDVKYETAVQYAHKLLERLDSADKTLDEKADSIIKYLGGGTAIVAVSAIFSAKTDTWVSCVFGLLVMLCVLPALVYSYWAVTYAVKCRRPQQSSLLPDVKYAVDISEYNKTEEKINANLWLILHPICEANLYRNLQKSSCVEIAHEYYLTSLKLLGVALLGIAISLLASGIIQYCKSPASPVQVQIVNDGKKS